MTDYEARIRKELQTARLVQDGAMPRSIPNIPGLNTAVYFHPASFIGGDFLQLVGSEDKRKLEVLIGDVCGKGVPAALIMAVVYCLFKEKSKTTKSPSELMCGVNVSLKEFLGAGSYFNSTAIWGEFDLNNMTYSYANAGHDFPLMYLKKTDELIELPSTGTLLGIFKESEYETKQVKISNEDYLLFYSDGLVDFFEAYNNHEDGYDYLKAFFAKRVCQTPVELVNEIKDLVEKNGYAATDDITVIAVKIGI